MNIRKHPFLCVLCAGIILLHSCKSAPENRHLVSVSILPQKYFVERIAGDYVQVNVMVPPGMNPATCDLSTAQLKKLYDSDLCFAIGCLPFETAHLFPVLEKRKDIRLVNHSEGIPLLSGTCSHAHHDGSHSHAGTDPHIWLSPKIAARMAATVFQTLAGQYPAEEETFRHNYNALAREIDSIAMRADKALADKQGRTFLIYHPALTYFAADYGLRQISITPPTCAGSSTLPGRKASASCSSKINSTSTMPKPSPVKSGAKPSPSTRWQKTGLRK